MLVKFPFRLGFVYAGRDAWRGMGASIEFGFGRRPNCPDYEICYRITGHLSWDWLPVRHYRVNSSEDSVVGHVDSSSWTGMHKMFIGFGEWRRSRGVTWIRGARRGRVGLR